MQGKAEIRGLKSLFMGVVILTVIGIIGFLYRASVEAPSVHTHEASSTPAAQACTAEAKICPDGSAVGRTGPGCAFVACALPNVEITAASTTLSFVLPSGYAKGTRSAEGNVLASYTQSAAASPSTITVSSFNIPAGETGSQVMLAQTIFDPSGLTATSSSQFKNVQFGKNVFSSVPIGRFEGHVQTAYYLQSGNQLLRFDIDEAGVQNWTDPALDIKTLSQHQAMQQMLATLELTPVSQL